MTNKVIFVSFDDCGNAVEETRCIDLPALPKWTMAENIGYTPMTSFWDDFSIAELYGPLAIADTLERAFKGWKHDVKYIAELSLVLNHKGLWYWQAAERFDNNPALQRLSELYFHAWEQLHDWAQKNFTGEAAEYYFNVTD